MKHLSRREFIKCSAALGAQALLASTAIDQALARTPGRPLPDLLCDLAVAKGDSPARN